jgi:hypothetical protein
VIHRALFPLIRQWKLFILGWARSHLTRHKPMHPDLPRVVVSLHWWENAR